MLTRLGFFAFTALLFCGSMALSQDDSESRKREILKDAQLKEWVRIHLEENKLDEKWLPKSLGKNTAKFKQKIKDGKVCCVGHMFGGDLEVGSIGIVLSEVAVDQVISPTEFLGRIHLQYGTPIRHMMFRGWDVSKVVDDEKMGISGICIVSEITTYQSLSGPRTVYVMEPLNLKKYVDPELSVLVKVDGMEAWIGEPIQSIKRK
ncbi:MAG TPA: hypothetical protein VNQ76_06200 [Planctomicrobium sp.]|nr:hypothetical protein [Planctomicrobium sp.]